VLQERTFRRLGGVVVHPFRARLVVSSRRDLSLLVREKVFRDDFFYRIDVVSVTLPRLSDRPEDILPLARQCLKESAREYGRPARRFSGDAEDLLSRHPWPGNVRELFHVVQKAALTAESAVVSAADLPASGSFGSPESLLAGAVERRWTLKKLSDAYIDETLRRSGGNRSLAAKRLGVSRKFLWERSRQVKRDPADLSLETPREPEEK
jgi:DNA-binding NtrC family response regulator